MSAFKSLKGSCPVCGGSRKDCRQNTLTNLIHCRHTEVNPPGYIFVKEDKCGFGMWRYKPDAEAYSQEKREEWRKEQEARKQQRLEVERQRKAESLDLGTRDRLYREILDQLTLHPDDKADLIRRGFTEEQIERSGFKSVEQWQRLDREIDNRLPGVSISGRSLNTQPGYLCPVRDADGYIVAMQLRLRDGGYRWLTSATEKRPNGQTAHVGDELPLAVHKPKRVLRWGTVGFAEGTGAKPFLAAERLKTVFIGASGGQWALSPEILKFYLGRIGDRIGSIVEYILYPDAGARNNQHIMRNYRALKDLLAGWGYQLRVAWWGQQEKTSGDIDELESSAYENIRYISWEEFSGDRPQQPEPRKTNQQEPKVDTSGIWKKLTQLTVTPWKTINTPQIDLEALNLERGAVYIILSAKGTHKTNALKPIVPGFKNTYAWFNRIALGREECHRIGVEWKDDLKGVRNGLKVGFCSDSSFQFNPGTLKDNGLLLVDECDQVFDHNFGDTCNKNGKRPLILSALQSQLASAVVANGLALFMSADVTDKEVEYIKAIAPAGCPVRVIVNEYKPKLGDIYFDNSKTPDGLIDALIRDLEAGKPCFLIDDVKDGVRGCKSIAEYVRKVHPEWADRLEEINSDTSGDPATINYLKNINEASLKTLLLACSPSVVSGISIQNGHFTRVYGFSNGVLTVSQMSQAIARVRGAESINLWVAPKGLIYQADRSLFPEQIKAYYQRNYEANAKHILAYNAQYNPLTDEWASPHFDLYCKNAAYRNLCMENLRVRMRDRLENEGYMVFDVDNGASEDVAGGMIDAWYGIELSHAEAVAKANILTDAQLRVFEDSAVRPTPKEQLDIKKTFLLKTYGQELIDSMTFEHKSGAKLTGYAAMLLKDNKGEYRKQLEALYLLMADQSEAIEKDLAVENRQLDNGQRFAGDVRWRTRQRKARIFLGLDKFLDPDKTFSPINFAGMAAKAKQNAGRVKDALGIDISKMTAGQIYGEFMGQLGLDLDKQWAPAPAANGRRYKLRKISAQSWEYAQMYVRHRTAPDEDNVPVEAVEAVQIPDHPPGYISSEPIGGGDQDLDHTEQELEPTRLLENNSEILAISEQPLNVPVEPIAPPALTPEEEEEAEIKNYAAVLSETLDSEEAEARTEAKQLWDVVIAWGIDVGQDISAAVIDRLTAGKVRQLRLWGLTG